MIETDPVKGEITQIKITDFGLSKINIPNEQMVESCGTPAYVAPEILLKQGYNQKVDIWAAGIIFYYLVRKQLPFKASDRMKTFELILNKNPDLNHLSFKHVHPEIVDVIMMMLDKNPQTRISASQILEHPLFSSIWNESHSLSSDGSENSRSQHL